MRIQWLDKISMTTPPELIPGGGISEEHATLTLSAIIMPKWALLNSVLTIVHASKVIMLELYIVDAQQYY